jgi:predicted nucleic acid-binding protein
MIVTLDSSVIIAALRKQEERHKECRNLLEKVKDGEFIALEPYIVMIEVVAAIRRRTGSKQLAERVKNDLRSIDTIKFLDLVSFRAEEAMEIATEISVRGMDAVVIQIAKEFDAMLVSLDKEMVEKAKTIVKIKDVEEIK